MPSNLEIECLLPADAPFTFVEVGVLRGTNLGYLTSRFTMGRFFGVDNWLPYVDNIYSERTQDVTTASMALRNRELAMQMASSHQVGGRVSFIERDLFDAALEFAPQSADFVFLDAHVRRGQICDHIKAWLPAVRPGGLLAGHEANVDNVMEDVRCTIKQVLPDATINVVEREVWWIQC